MDGFRNPVKNDLRTSACLEILLNTDENFINLHTDKARKTHDDKQLYLITHFRKQTLNLSYFLLTVQLLNSPKQKGISFSEFSLNGGGLVFWFAFSIAVHFQPNMALTLEIPYSKV